MAADPPTALNTLNRYPLLLLVGVLSCLAYLALLMGGLGAISDLFLPRRAAAFWNSPWQLWTPTFVHYTALHLVTNLLCWGYLAAQIERHSRALLLTLLLLAGGIANLCQWLISGPDFGGLSAVVYAALGYLWLTLRLAPTAPYRLDRILALALLVLIPVTATGAFGKYAIIAHVTGLVCGAAIAFVHQRLLSSGLLKPTARNPEP